MYAQVTIINHLLTNSFLTTTEQETGEIVCKFYCTNYSIHYDIHAT